MEMEKPRNPARKGYDAGGVRTVEGLKLRSRVDPVTGCWNWLQGLIGPHHPKVHLVHPVTGKRFQTTGRRAAVLLATGKEVPKGHTAWARACCDSDLCVNPAHVRTGTRKAHGEWLARTAQLKGRPAYYAASRRRAKGQQALTAEQVAEIRRNPGVTVRTYAERFNVAPSVIWSARKHLTYTDVAMRVSVFDLGGIAA